MRREKAIGFICARANRASLSMGECQLNLSLTKYLNIAEIISLGFHGFV